jgi:hypothetical protein
VLSGLLVCLVVACAFVGALIAGLALFLREIYLGVSTGTHHNR